MAYTAQDVKNLRETTGAGMMDCKKALEETGDFQKAVDFLRAKGLAAAAKKQSRIAAEGTLAAVVKGNFAALVEVNCETDFVAKNDAFQEFAKTAATVAVHGGLHSVEELLNAKATETLSIKDTISELTIKIGEKIDVRRLETLKLEHEGVIGSYVHSGKIGVLACVETDKDLSGEETFTSFVKDICMQIAAADPKFLTSDDIDESYKAKEAEIYAAQLKEQGKPEAMIPNIVKGKLNKLASEVCLYEQSFVKDTDISVGKLIENTAKALGAQIKVSRFIKLNLGEGVEKKSENFAEEIAKLTGQN